LSSQKTQLQVLRLFAVPVPTPFCIHTQVSAVQSVDSSELGATRAPIASVEQVETRATGLIIDPHQVRHLLNTQMSVLGVQRFAMVMWRAGDLEPVQHQLL
jgi:hypothetical protein